MDRANTTWDVSDAFDTNYEYFMRHFHTNEVNRAECDLMVKLIDLHPGQYVLDIPCGYGRISLELSRRGIAVRGVDRSPDLIQSAIRDAELEGSSVRYDIADMRGVELEPCRHDAVIVWFTSFGFDDDATSALVLEKIYQTLKPGGRLLLETINPIPFYAALSAKGGGRLLEKQSVGTDFLLDQYSLGDLGSRISSERIMVRSDSVRRVSFSLRLFGPYELDLWLRRAGFADVALYDERGDTYDWRARRLVAVATK